MSGACSDDDWSSIDPYVCGCWDENKTAKIGLNTRCMPDSLLAEGFEDVFVLSL